ncbi:tight junction-associated protein 1 isoform X3 [Phyllopteryx taeniolatus]|uniref:tight junction-associated protein 1 isoform X3 n=1 Tax=Phyllopteryx taeniolatus TaxID=161469 RepID=UPI002AD46427|nr:tight junction-associated protein 1 isoform X3 [Phyllopteryx taeniolatus]
MEQLVQRGAAAPPRSILKKGASRGEERAYDVFRKSGSAELLDGCTGRGAHFLATSTFEREPPPHQQVSSSLPSAHRKHLAWRTMHFLEEKVRFSNFLDEITCRVINPPHLMPIVRGPSRCHGSPTPRPRDRHPRKRTSDGESADRKRRWDRWVAALRRSEGAGYREEVLKEVLSDSDRIRILQQQNEDLRRRLSLSSHKMDAMEVEFDGNRHYMEAELSRTRDDLDKMRDKFRRLQNSYTASQRANQDLEEKLHALAAVSQTWVHALRTVERDKKTMDQEMVELTNKLLEAKNTIDRLEELNERYRLDCNLAVQLLKCNKSHFRNHKFADLPCELQDMLNKHMKSSSLPERSPGPRSQDPDTLSLTPSDVVPTSMIARVLEKPEPLLLNSAQSSSRGWPAAEDVFVHVDMTAEGRGAEDAVPRDGSCRDPDCPDAVEEAGGAPSFEKLNPYPPPPPPNPLYPGRKVIEFSSDDKVKIPKNSPLPNCTYATRQAISLSLQGEQQPPPPPSPAPSRAALRHHGGVADTPSSQSSPFSSPPQAPSMGASSASSSEDLLANWQRLFVDKMAPSVAGGGAPSRVAYSDGEEGSTPSHASSVDTDTDAEPRPDARGERLLMNSDPDRDGATVVMVTAHTCEEEEEEDEEEEEEPGSLARDLPVISPSLLDYDSAFAAAALPRPHRSPKRMGVHHLHRHQQ